MKKYKYEKRRVDLDTPIDVINLYKQFISYNPGTGELKNTKTNTVYGKTRTKGYLQTISIRYNNIEYQIIPHRLIWILVYDKILPQSIQIDHRNGVKTDNRLVNLRECSNSENQMNSRSIRGSIDYRGVSLDNSALCAKYTASICIDGKHRKIGRFFDSTEAAKFYDSAARFYFKEFANPNFDEQFIEPKSLEDLRLLVKQNKLNQTWELV
jgi:hypothetical protein